MFYDKNDYFLLLYVSFYFTFDLKNNNRPGWPGGSVDWNIISLLSFLSTINKHITKWRLKLIINNNNSRILKNFSNKIFLNCCPTEGTSKWKGTIIRIACFFEYSLGSCTVFCPRISFYTLMGCTFKNLKPKTVVCLPFIVYELLYLVWIKIFFTLDLFSTILYILLVFQSYFSS